MRGITKTLKERRINIKELTSKEKLFCMLYAAGREPAEAAEKAGYIFAEKNGLKLLRRDSIREEISRLQKQKKNESHTLCQGYYRLAFGCISDAVRLLFTEELTEKDIGQMNLFNVSEIKRKKGGDIEIKFFDRLKALDRLSEIILSDEEKSENSIFSAIEKGVKALEGERVE